MGWGKLVCLRHVGHIVYFVSGKTNKFLRNLGLISYLIFFLSSPILMFILCPRFMTIKVL